MRRIVIGLLALLVVVAVVVAMAIWTRTGRNHAAKDRSATASSAKAIPAAAASPPDDGNWTMPAKDYAATRFSGLTEITPANVGRLQVSFTFSTGTTEGTKHRRWSSAGRCMSSRPGRTSSTRSTSPSPALRSSGRIKPNPAAAAKGVACCDVVNRGASYANGRLFLDTLDGQTDRARRGNAARRSGEPGSATFRKARRSRWRRSSPTAKCWSAIRAARSGCAAGSRRSMPAAASWSGRPTAPARTRKC